jgi:hypothetical protein
VIWHVRAYEWLEEKAGGCRFPEQVVEQFGILEMLDDGIMTSQRPA